jgi:Zn-dependent peptidase ImmA (M78 family)/transcriptional regulator with XRE-family HTH domain
MISSQQLGERLADSRKRLKRTQAQVAKELGVARTTLLAIEKGERRPSSAELVRLAGILGVAVNDLLRESVVRAEISPRFRAGHPSTPSVAQAAERLRTLATRYVELEVMHGLKRRRAPLETLDTYRMQGRPPASVAAAEGAEAAVAVRALLGMGDTPAHDLDQRLESEAGLRIFYLDHLPSKVAAFLIWTDDIGGCVAINRAHPAVRQRWSLVHEFGHFLRDRELGDVLDTEDPRGPQEVFPEWFAREFLMPTTGVRKRFAERCRSGRFTPVDLYGLAQTYGVAFQAMAWRLEELELLPRGTYQKIVDSKLRPRELAPHSSESRDAVNRREVGLPERYIALAISAFDQGFLSELEFARYLEQDVTAARDIYARKATFNIDDHLELPVDYSESDLRALG